MQKLLFVDYVHEIDIETGNIRIWKVGEKENEFVGTFARSSELPAGIPAQFKRTLEIMLNHRGRKVKAHRAQI